LTGKVYEFYSELKEYDPHLFKIIKDELKSTEEFSLRMSFEDDGIVIKDDENDESDELNSLAA
jgi:hypothetical protein